MDAETGLRTNLRWLINLNAACIDIILDIFDNKLRVFCGQNDREILPPVEFDYLSPLDILRLVVTVLEEKCGSERVVAFSFESRSMDVRLAEELVRIAHEEGRRTILRGVYYACRDLDVALIPSFVQMVERGSSIRKLSTSVALMTCMLENGAQSDCSLEELQVNGEWQGSVIATFARTLHVKKLTVQHVGPVADLGVMSELESLRVVQLGPQNPLDFLETCPNLTSFRIDHVYAGTGYDVAARFLQISSLRRLTELYMNIHQTFGGWQRDAVDFLSGMTSLRKLELHVTGFDFEMQRYLVWALPRLEEYAVNSDGVGVDWDDAILRKKNWLCRVALTIPFGDLSRELAEYL
jgi:hypothetical protein